MRISKSKKWLIGIVSSILILLLIGQWLINSLFIPVIESGIQDMVAEKSNGLYSLSKIESNWNLSTSTLKVRDLCLEPDSNTWAKRKADGTAPKIKVELEIPEMDLEIQDLRNALFRRTLVLEHAVIHDPKIRIASDLKTEKLVSETEKLQSLYPLIQEQLRSLFIEDFSLENGYLHFTDQEYYHQRAFESHDLSLRVKDFNLDSLSAIRLNRPFDASEISLSMDVDKLMYLLPDSSYVLQMGTIGFSSEQGRVFAEDIHVKPNYRPYQLALQRGDIPPNLFELVVPSVQLSGIGFKEAYFDGLLMLDSVRILDPQIIQLGPVDRKPDRSLESFDPRIVFDKVQQQFQQVHLGGLFVENGRFRKLHRLGDRASMVDLDGIDLTLETLKLDSSLIQNPRRLFFSDELELFVDRYALNLGKGNYQLLGRDAGLSSAQKKLRLDQFQIRPSPKKIAESFLSGADLFNINVPGVEINGLDLVNSWFDRVVDVSSVKVSTPNIDLTNYPKIEKSKVDSLARQNLYDLVSGFLDSLRIRDLQIDQGAFHLQTQKSEALPHESPDTMMAASEFNVRMVNFQLNQGAREQTGNPFYADDIDIQLKIDAYSYWLPDSSYAISAGGIGISTADSAIFADSIHLIPHPQHVLDSTNHNQNAFEILIPRLHLKGFDVHQAYFNKVLDVDSIGLHKVAIRLDRLVEEAQQVELMTLDSINLYPLIRDRLQALRIGRFSMDSASFYQKREYQDTISYFSIPSFSFDAYDFALNDSVRIGPDNILYAKDLHLHIEDFSQALPDSIHRLNLGALDLSTRSKSIIARNVELKPIDPGMSTQTHYDLRLPHLQIDSVDAYELYQQKILEVDRVFIRNPQLMMSRLPDVEKEQIDSIAQSDPYELISSQLNAFRVKRFLITNGIYQFKSGEDQQQPFEADEILVLIENFQIDSASRRKTDNPFYADDIDVSINIKPYAFYSGDSTYQIQVGNVGVSTADSSIFIEDIFIRPQEDHPIVQEKVNVFDFYIPRMQLNGISSKGIYFDRNMDLATLRIQRPVIRWKVQAPEIPGPTPRLDLYTLLKPHLNMVRVDQIQLLGGRLFQERPDGDSIIPIHLDQFSLHANGFELDSLDYLRPNRLFFSDYMILETGYFSYPVANGLYQMEWQGMKLNSHHRSLMLDSLSLIPQFDISEYALEHGHRIGRLTTLTDRVEMYEIDPYSLLAEDQFHFPKVYVGGMDMVVFNERFWDPNPKYKPSPHRLMHDFPLDLQVDSLWLRGGFISYHEKAKADGLWGELFIDEVEATLANWTNQFQTVSDPVATMDVYGKLMGEGELYTHFTYPLLDTAEAYQFHGYLGPMDLDKLNEILEPSANVRVNRGLTDSLTFRIRSDRRKSRGRMSFYYKDLNVSVLDQDEKDGGLEPTLVRKFWRTFFANTIVRSDNPKRRFLRVGRVDYVHDPYKSFVGHWVGALLSGVKSSVGLSNKETKDKKLGLKRQKP